MLKLVIFGVSFDRARDVIPIYASFLIVSLRYPNRYPHETRAKGRPIRTQNIRQK